MGCTHRRLTAPVGRASLVLLSLSVVLGVTAPGSARADGAVTLVSGELRFSSDSQDAENLGHRAGTNALNCTPLPVPCLQLANGPQRIRDQVATTACEQLRLQRPALRHHRGLQAGRGTRLRVTLDDGDDFAAVGAGIVPTTPGRRHRATDNLSSDSGSDTLIGGGGDDVLSDDGSAGDDAFDGGAGNDSISISGGNDDVTGGAGTDGIIMDSATLRSGFDGLPRTTAPPAREDNIRPDVEVIDGGAGSDNLFGNAAANTLRGGSGNDLLDGGDGPDVLEGGMGADDLAGGADQDRVVYSDTAAQTITLDGVRDDGAAQELDNVRPDIEDVAAGRGNDVVVGSDAANVLDGGDGDDRLTGGGGVDTYVGGAGADTLLARDGAPERVDCGAQSDTGEADTIDQLVDCEGIAVSSALVPDLDGDGVDKPADCHDGNAVIRPGAVDVADNGVDEDCSGADAVNLDRDADGVLRPATATTRTPRSGPARRTFRATAWTRTAPAATRASRT